MYAVNYHRAGSVAEAVKLAETGETKFLAGGMTLIPAMKTRLAAPSDIVDITRIEGLAGVKVSGRKVTIGAATTHADVAASAELAAVCPALSELAAHIGDPHVRHMGTIGGSIANNDPAADYPAAMLALDATIVTDRRSISAQDFFTGLFETALEEGEMVTSVSFEAPEKAGYEKFRNPASRYAMTGVFVVGGANAVRAAVTGAGDGGVFRSSEVEAALAKRFEPAALDGVTVPSASLMGDIHASPEYRANLVVVMAKRAVAKAA
jgi:aerobic carbon-monoxide dehydrogenase medium subunit